MAGGLLQLVAYGQEDILLTKNPDFTYFKLVYKKYINFAVKQYKNIFEHKPLFGKNKNIVKISKEGDLINNIIFKTNIVSNNSNKLGLWNYTSNFGFSMIKKVDLIFGNQIVNTLYGNWLNIWKEILKTKQDSLKINSMINNSQNNYDYENKSLDLYIPLPFFLIKNISLPIVNLKNIDIYLSFEFREAENLINKQDYYFDKNQSINTNPDITNQTYNITLEMQNSFLLVDYILIDKCELKIFYDLNEKLIEVNKYQEEILDINNNNYVKEIFLNNPVKYNTFVVQPNNLLNKKKYLAYPGDNFFEIAAKRFCLRYCATGWIGNNDYLLPYAKYGVFQNDSGESINGIGYKIAFDHGLTSLKNNGNLSEQEKIIYDLFNKLNPIIIKYYGNKVISAKIDNIKVNIKNLNKQDKYILSLPTEFIDSLLIEGGNNNSVKTGDNNNEGNSNYDIRIIDYTIYSTFLNNEFNFIDKLSIKFDNLNHSNEYDAIYFNSIEPIKYNLSSNINSIYSYSYSLYPFDNKLTGSCNFSQINKLHINLIIKIKDNQISNLIYKPLQHIVNNSKLIIFSNSYNILQISNDNVSLKYVN